MASKKKQAPQVDPKQLEKLVEADPSTLKWNNPNSRKNLKQYQQPTVPEVLPDAAQEEQELQIQAQEIVQGRKLDPAWVKKLIPRREVFTPKEKERFSGIVTTYLADFKTEEPTATDIDDIFEIAKCDILETRLLEASKKDPSILVSVSQSTERLYKRKQSAKENLASRRIDRKDNRSSQDVSIVDLVVAFDKHRVQMEEERVEKLLAEEKATSQRLHKIIEEEDF